MNISLENDRNNPSIYRYDLEVVSAPVLDWKDPQQAVYDLLYNHIHVIIYICIHYTTLFKFISTEEQVNFNVNNNGDMDSMYNKKTYNKINCV